MKAVAVIRGIRNEPAIFQHHPISGLVPCPKIDRRAPNNENRNERVYTESRVNRKPKNQSSTSNWLMILNSQRPALKLFSAAPNAQHMLRSGLLERCPR